MSTLLTQIHGAVLQISLNRPEKHNALNTDLTQRLLDSLEVAKHDPEVRAIVLHGKGKSFCAGADTGEFKSFAPDTGNAAVDRADLTTALHLAFSRTAKPVIAAVHGNALGGGAGLALACDMVVMAEDVRFGYPELKHGIVAAVVLANLVRQAGLKHAFELVSMAEPIDGHRALALGLANRVCPAGEVLDQALALAGKLAAWSPAAMATTKRTFYRAADLSLEAALAVGRDANVMMRGFDKK
ncbi:enoyl-CoA hydratase/isomerase family protein [Candidimonas nitroreducens]|uniref:Enoyl-CoA hydratase n=1 Tax=Candidimonas nitroreducens TaxID=683354 RepID=A0A225MRG4_9BURK|nr:enoyl-CoA hydratase/isomerase family protein [Candidimonas nitroreducens]OWT62061.1 enoyl-CoA hydratase [Candidimonas nitroreducens]